MIGLRSLSVISLGFVLALAARSQSGVDPNSASRPKQQQKHTRGAAKEIGSGAGSVGVGAAKGAGDVGKGAGKGAVDLVTLHPVEAGASVGKGAAKAGKDVTVGTAKGTGKVTKGIGRAFKHEF